MKQRRLFELTELVYKPIQYLTKDSVEEAAGIARGLLQHSEEVTFREIAEAKLGTLSQEDPLEDWRSLSDQVEALKNSRAEIAEHCPDLRLVAVEKTGRPSFGAGRNEPVGFSAASDARYVSNGLQAKAALGKIKKTVQDEHASGRLSSDRLSVITHSIDSITGLLATGSETEEAVHGAAA